MEELRGDGRVARLLIALAITVGATALFATLGGIRLAHSAIARDQYDEVRHIAITKGTASRKGRVTLRVTIIGWKMYPGLIGKPLNKTDGGHWAIFVDSKCNAVSANRKQGTTRPLKTGKRKIYAALANNDGSYLVPNVRSNTVTVKVKRTVKKKGKPPRSCRPAPRLELAP
jgi:hypothetical protein